MSASTLQYHQTSSLISLYKHALKRKRMEASDQTLLALTTSSWLVLARTFTSQRRCLAQLIRLIDWLIRRVSEHIPYTTTKEE
jgi:hypothetical protein